MRFVFALTFFALLGCAVWEIRPGPRLRESPLPASLARRTLSDSDTVNLAATLRQWHPRDWRACWVAALANDDAAGRAEDYASALRLRPREPMLLYCAALDRLEGHSACGDSAAFWFLSQALAQDPDNGVLDLTWAVAQVRLGNYPEARTVFLRTRGFPQADLYGVQAEREILALLDAGLRLNPYDLIQAEAWYRKIPLPPIEEWSQALETIFLDPLKEHPYDIRRRGREAALGLYRLGNRIGAESLSPDRIFSDGREERLLGLLLQAKAVEFLQHYAEAFAAPLGIGARKVDALTPALLAARQSAAALPEVWDHFLSHWERLAATQPELLLGPAADQVRGEQVWREVTHIYPARHKQSAF